MTERLRELYHVLYDEDDQNFIVEADSEDDAIKVFLHERTQRGIADLDPTLVDVFPIKFTNGVAEIPRDHFR